MVSPIGLKKDGWEFLRAVWLQQPHGFYLIRLYDPQEDNWATRWLDRNEVSRSTSATFPQDKDVYFSPVAYKKKRALKENVLPSCWLFADLDYMHPKDAPISPDAAWETSPNKWQALWYLQNHAEPEEFRHLNRAICHACGADPGTWNTNRLLRVPGTKNLKGLRRAA